MNIRQRHESKRSTQAEREARKVFAAQEAEKALSEYESAQRAFHANRERLKAERLAREAAASKTLSLAIQDS
jgi:outer membrane protein TolC